MPIKFHAIFNMMWKIWQYPSIINNFQNIKQSFWFDWPAKLHHIHSDIIARVSWYFIHLGIFMEQTSDINKSRPHCTDCIRIYIFVPIIIFCCQEVINMQVLFSPIFPCILCLWPITLFSSSLEVFGWEIRKCVFSCFILKMKWEILYLNCPLSFTWNVYIPLCSNSMCLKILVDC